MHTYKILTLYPTGMDWNCPAFNEVLGKQLTKHHGNITVENTIRDVVSIVQTGNLQVAVYDLTKNLAYLSNAKASYESGPQYAYERLMNIFFLSFVSCLLVSIFRINYLIIFSSLQAICPTEHDGVIHWNSTRTPRKQFKPLTKSSYIIKHHFLFPSSLVCFLDFFSQMSQYFTMKFI